MVKGVKVKTTSAVESVPEEVFAAVMKNFRDHQKIDLVAQRMHIVKIFNANKNGHCFSRLVQN
jgi:hypothetical protein